MVVVAVAGGTGKVGRTIVEAIVAAGKHSVVVLSRKENPELAKELGVAIVAVDYDDIPALAKTLDEQNVHTVISALFMVPGPAGPPKELELIRAADASKTTKRMISSDWGVPHQPEHIPLLGSVEQKMKAHEELEKTTDLEWTHVINGFFMDFWGTRAIKSHMEELAFVVDIPNAEAAIPGDGNTPIAMTHTSDMGKFVAASLDLDKWDRVTYIEGDRITPNEMLRWAEEATGKKFSVTYDNLDKLKAGESTELPGQVLAYGFIPKQILRNMLTVFGRWFADGTFNYKAEKKLNDVFPEIKPISVKELVDRNWRV